MKVELKPKLFSDVIGIINQLVTEVSLRFSDEGLSIIALDPASIAMTIFEMPKTSFIKYEGKNEVIAVNLDDLKQVLRRIEKADSIIIEKRDNLLTVESRDGIKRKFHLALINIDEEEKKKPELNFSSFVELNSELFKDAIEDAKIIADSCSFITNKDEESFKIIAVGTINKSEIEFGSDEAKISAGNDKAKYSLEYMDKFVKASKIFDKVKISFKTDHPCQLDFFSRDSDVKLSFILAPRVEEE